MTTLSTSPSLALVILFMNVARAMGFFLFIVIGLWDIALTSTLSFYTLCRLGIVVELGPQITFSQGNSCTKTTIG